MRLAQEVHVKIANNKLLLEYYVRSERKKQGYRKRKGKI